VRYQGAVLVDAFLLPPLQVLAAALNFLTLLITANPLFDLPFKSIHDMVDSKALRQNAGPGKKRGAAPKGQPS
jgi:hypothetical protein